MLTRTLILALALSLPAQAQNKLGQPEVPPGVDPSLFNPLTERKDLVPWRLLAQVELVKMKDRYVPQFSSAVHALDKKEVKMQGFILPLQVGEKQTHFVLSRMPLSCPYCLPGGPETLVEVNSTQPVKYSFEPVVLSGKLEVLKDDPAGLFYRLTGAVLSN